MDEPTPGLPEAANLKGRGTSPGTVAGRVYWVTDTPLGRAIQTNALALPR